MANKQKIINKTTGLNTILDPFQAQDEIDSNGKLFPSKYLAACQNCDINNSHSISVRLGQNIISEVSSHSVFCDGGDCFVAQDRGGDAAIYRIANDYSLLGIRSGLTEGAFISYCQIENQTFYTNGNQNGVITDGVSAPWPVDIYNGPDTLNHYSPAPIGKHIAYFMGRMWISVGGVIYCSEPYKPGLFRLSKCFFQFGTNIRMIRPVSGGVWISDSEKTGFILPANKWSDYRFVPKSSFPAHEWSDNCRLVDLSKSQWQVQGLSAVWSSDDGICIGTSDGQLINVTKEKLVYPTGANGATVVNEGILINTVY